MPTGLDVRSSVAAAISASMVTIVCTLLPVVVFHELDALAQRGRHAGGTAGLQGLF